MRILKKRTILKLAATFMLVGMMAGVFAMHARAAFAATTITCGGVVFGDTGVTTGDSCAMAVPGDVTGLGFVSDTTVTLTPGPVNGVQLFTFTTTVTDTLNTPDGWRLQATSPGMQVNGTGTVLPVTIGAVTPIAGDCNTSTCGTLSTGTGELPTDSLVTIMTAGGSSDINGTLTVHGTGSFTVLGTTPPGTYTGAITLSLLNTSS